MGIVPLLVSVFTGCSRADLDVHLIFVILDHSGMIFINMAVVLHPVHDHQNHIGHRRVNAHVMSIVLGVYDVLAMDSDTSAGFIIAVDDLGHLVVISRAAGEAAAGCFKGGLQVNAAFAAKA